MASPPPLSSSVSSSCSPSPGSSPSQSSLIPASEGDKKVYNIIAFMQLGLHPFRGNTKYRIQDYQLVPMPAHEYKINLYLLEINYQGVARKLMGAGHDDLLSIAEELIIFFRRYLWDEETKPEAIDFLIKVVLPGFQSLQNITYSETTTSETVDNWISLVNFALREPITKNDLVQRITDSPVVSTKFFKNVLECLERRETSFGTQVKGLVTKALLQQINVIFAQTFFYPETAIDYKKRKEAFERGKIESVEREIKQLHSAYICLARQATFESAPPEKPGSRKNSDSTGSSNGQGGSPAGTDAANSNGTQAAAGDGKSALSGSEVPAALPGGGNASTTVVAAPPPIGIVADSKGPATGGNVGSTTGPNPHLQATPIAIPKGRGGTPSAPLPNPPKGKQPPAAAGSASAGASNAEPQPPKVTEDFATALSASMTLERGDYKPPAATTPAASAGGNKGRGKGTGGNPNASSGSEDQSY